ncbi:MAG TPA: DUF3486 family protein [Aliidongia sp.]|nr:DUF3486 family protein [Aliidongia sp.]
MPRASTIDKLAPELRQAIADLRDQGVTIDEILAKLRELGADVSRSALGRHVKDLDQIADKLRRSREVADVLVRRLGDAPESKQARVNIELMHAVIMDLFVGDDGTPVQLDPESVMLLSRSIASLASASKTDADLVIKVRREIAAEQKAKLDAMDREASKGGSKRGFDPETLKRVRTEIYGLPG